MRGQCLCGEVQFELWGKVLQLYQCHCSLCRKQGGSVSNTVTLVKKKQLVWVAGQTNINSYVRSTGFRSDFCCRCGSPVPNLLRGLPYWWIPAGLLEDSADLKIVLHLHVGSKAAWDELPNSGVHEQTMPELRAIWQQLQVD